ncbi:RDD family protein [Azospirillum sp. B4]|uniref:RDD family protein n=1 Tax=Azospirillum sp. B4 TaxID=95605 RepID=UPI0003487EC1|nr:RDD family protein [Azospirillum sp. B4]
MIVDTTPIPPPAVAPILAAGWDYASFGRRWAALWIDKFICLAATLLMALVAFIVSWATGGLDQVETPEAEWGFGALFQMVFILYDTAFVASAHQATPGKRILKLVVGHVDGRRLSWPRALGRATMKSVISLPVDIAGQLDAHAPEILPIKLVGLALMLLNYLPAAFTLERTGGHDLSCGSRVFKLTPPVPGVFPRRL